MISLKTLEEIEKLREGGKRLARILLEVAKEVKPGVRADHLNKKAEELILAGGDTSAFLGYKPKGARRQYPASLCVSINDEVVHGVPNETLKVLKEGDIVSLDLGLIHDHLYVDHAITVAVGVISHKAQKLLDVTKTALDLGIKEAWAGKRTGDIGAAIEKYARKHHMGVIEELAGHGVGYAVHEDPFVPNFGNVGEGVMLRPGMVIAIEPMFTLGKPDIILAADGYTYITRDKSLSAHFEHTIVIREDVGPEILTLP